MGRKPCCSKVGLNRGTWNAQEDRILTSYIKAHGEGQWRNLPKRAGLKRCGKSCRLRWMNYLKPDLKKGNITPDEEDLILRLHRLLGNRWSLIAGRLPGRTDNEIKNYWHTILRKKLKPDPSPKANYKGLLKTTTEGTRIIDEIFPSAKVKISTQVLKPVPTKATQPVKCPEFPLMNPLKTSTRGTKITEENFSSAKVKILPAVRLVPTKATRAVKCPEFPLINSNPPKTLRESFHLELPILQRSDQVGTDYSSGDDLRFFDFENDRDDLFPASNFLSMEALLMEECINNVNIGWEDENNKNSFFMEGLDMFLSTEQCP